MSRDYAWGPEHAWYSARGTKLGAVQFGRKIKSGGQKMTGSRHGAPMAIACFIIVVMLAADLLGQEFKNGAEIAWVALFAVIAVAVSVMAAMRRTAKAPASTSTELDVASERRAISGDPARNALENRLAQTESLLAEVLLRAREHDREPR